MKGKISSVVVVWVALILVISAFGLMISAGEHPNIPLMDDGRIDEDIGPPVDIDPPVENGEMFRNRTTNAAAHGSVTFLRVGDYKPWAASVINAGDPRGVDEVTISFENDTLVIEARDSNHTNHVSILINRNFADEYLAEAESNIEMNISDAVNYKGLEDSNASVGGNGVYVFHIEHFSTQRIEISQKRENIPPVEKGEIHRNRVNNAASRGAASFLKVEDYEPWAALVVNAGDPAGIDEVTISFENNTLTIEATDSNHTNSVTIMLNREFADEHLADAEGDLEIETSDAVNYEGEEKSNDSEGAGRYVFHIEHFSTQTIKVSAVDSLPSLSTPMLLLVIMIPVAYYALKKKKE